MLNETVSLVSPFPDTARRVAPGPLLLDWFQAHHVAVHSRTRVGYSGALSELLDFLEPVAADFWCALNPSFLSGFRKIEDLQREKTWLARDGLIPLLWFFSRFPTPDGFSGRILVHEDFVPFVPLPWIERVGAYRLGRLPESAAQPSISQRLAPLSSLLFVGINSESYCDLPTLQGKLRWAQRRFRELAGRKPAAVSVCLFPRLEPLAGWDEVTRFFAQSIVEICKEFGPDVNVMGPKEFERCQLLSGCAVVDLNQNLLCASSTPVHAALAKGSGLLEEDLGPGYDEYHPVSFVYGFGIRTCIRASEFPESRPIPPSLAEGLSSPAQHRFPWAKWFNNQTPSEVRISPLTGLPTALVGPDSLLMKAVTGHRLGLAEGIRLHENGFTLSGWSIDRQNLSLPDEVVMLHGERSVVGKLTRVPRPDVLESLGVEDPSLLKCGFMIEVASYQLRQGDVPACAGSGVLISSDTIHVWSVHGRRIAALLGAFRVGFDPDQRVILTDLKPRSPRALACRWSLREGLLEISATDGAESARVRGQHFYHIPSGPEKPSLHGTVDALRAGDSVVEVSGWAMDLETGRSAEAVLISFSPEDSWVVPMHFYRPDLETVEGKSCEMTGFNSQFPKQGRCSGLPRFYALFENRLAIELGVTQ